MTGLLMMGYSIACLALGKLVAIEGLIKLKETQQALIILFVCGLVLTVFFSIESSPGYTFTNWKRSSNGFVYERARPPFSVESDRMYVTAQVFVNGPGTKIDFRIVASDCLKSVHINDRKIPISDKCTPCMHCKPFKLDPRLWTLLEPGQNTVGFEIISLGKYANFTVIQ